MEQNTLWSDQRVRGISLVILGLLALFLLVITVAKVKEIGYIGRDTSSQNTISVSGEGEVVVKPDVATVSFSAMEEAATVAAAQEKVDTTINKALEFLKTNGIEENLIKTVGYNVYPQYDYIQAVCTQFSCPPGRQVLRGYQVSQQMEVKIKDIAKAGDILTGLGTAGVNNVSGLSFTVEDEEAVIAQAREAAINDARAKAAVLADSLDVKIVRVVSFSENNNGYPYFYKTAPEMMSIDGRGGADAAVANVPVGENQVTSNVTIIYEIR